ncbi:MAG TPA: carboxypeptidase regulatory-like domain-containing protein [Candidatus Sulfotelmatobacter sp.]|nr:carboxypeptidase regulatory-like domain-containing protein [Candidatus Sulfotelmatobacter sp.]
MNARMMSYRNTIGLAFLLFAFQSIVLAQSTGALRGQVTDPSGAAVVNAEVALTPETGAPVTTKTNGQGLYEFKELPAGKYTINVVAQGFSIYENDSLVITDQALRLNAELAIQVQEQKIQVSDTAPTVDVNPANNAGAIVISGKELDALPDDPDELQSDLQALAGPSAGPNGGQMYIDGFTAGQLPPKASIREIRVNQNPFSSEYDKLGYGRIEIFTKPGTDKFHGQFYIDGNASAFNSPNPFAGAEPSYDSTQYSGNLGGPINKNASFFVNVERRNINDLSAINALTLDSTSLAPTPVIESVPFPRGRTNISPRIDYALSKNNTLTARYQYYRDTETNDGIGQFTLPSQAYNATDTEHTFQIGDTQVFGAKIVNETRFQYLREIDTQKALSTAPTINVRGSFDGGGNNQGTNTDHQDHYEFQNYTSVIHGNHTIKFGARVRALRDASFSTSDFNGTFTFSSLNGETDLNCHSATDPNPLPLTTPCPVSYLYAQQQLQAHATPAATQLSITTGRPNLDVVTYDGGLYFQDDWRAMPNVTLSYGLRFETQNYIHDHADWAPRLGFAWGIGGRTAPPKLVLRGGFGIFYDRFQSEQVLQAERVNGFVQQQFVVNNPTCFPDPAACSLNNAVSPPTVYRVDPRLHAPYTLQTAVSAERQVTKSATLSITYLNSRGFDQFATINANAPLPGTTIRPFPTQGNLYEYVSEAVFRQNQLIVNTNIRVGSKVQLFGYYTLNYANSNASGVSNFASNSYNLSQDYGRASFDTRHRLFLGGSIAFPYAVRLSPFMVASSGSPFNITTANDLNGDSIFNDRPGVVSTLTCPTTVAPAPGSTIFCTPFGTLNTAGGPRILPINDATGPARFTLHLRLTKTFGFGGKTKGPSGPQGGPGGGGGGGGGGHGGGGPRGPLFGGGPVGMSTASDRRYNLTLGVHVRNIFNNVNTANPSGVLGSRFFDVPNALAGGPFSSSAANRRIDLQATFSF